MSKDGAKRRPCESELNALLAYCFHLAVERHEQCFHFEIRVFLVDHSLELLKLRGVGVFLDLGVFGVLSAENDLVRAAIAVIHDDDRVDIMKLDRDIEMLPKGLVSGRVLVGDRPEGSAGKHDMIVLVSKPAAGHVTLDIVHEPEIHAAQ